MAAFRQAAVAGADMVELDVRLTRDLEPVVLHDRTLRRTTGWNCRIWLATLQEVRQLDAGSWYSRAFRGQRIPHLGDVLNWLPGGVRLNIEVKTDGDPRPATIFEHAIVRLLRHFRSSHRILVSSFDHRFLRRLGRLLPSVSTAALFMPIRDSARPSEGIVEAAGASALVCSTAWLRSRMVRDLHANLFLLYCYRVNTRFQLTRAVRFGVDGIITDYPARILGMLKAA
jgi:glycerophosphoryl diester phosphodiesterase